MGTLLNAKASNKKSTNKIIALVVVFLIIIGVLVYGYASGLFGGALPATQNQDASPAFTQPQSPQAKDAFKQDVVIHLQKSAPSKNEVSLARGMFLNQTGQN